MKWLLIAQAADGDVAGLVENGEPPATNGFVCLTLIVALVLCFVIFRWKLWQQQQEALRKLRSKLLEKQEQLKAEYSKEYEQRKLTIGTIKCSQCKWSGEWGTGMSYKQFFAGDLAEHEIYVGRSKGEKSSLSLNNRQYECPVCNSLSWEKV